jgi:uncharacterized protein (DUF488 family)
MELPRIITIGVYGFEEEDFFRALQAAGVDTFCDIRRRRGVRGAQYAFANSRRLQARLAELNIGYIHRLDLAPSPGLRDRQHTVDAAAGTRKRQRAVLDDDFAEGYRRECLDGLDGRRFLEELGAEARVIAFFCVEREPTACHRSLLAAHLHQDLGVEVMHLLPPGSPAA